MNLVTGATGHIGNVLVRTLVKHGQKVRALVLPGENLQPLEGLEVEVAYAIGIRPRTELAKQAGVEVDRGIVVNEYMQTNVPDIYAAGDVAQVYDPSTGRAVLDSLWGPARHRDMRPA